MFAWLFGKVKTALLVLAAVLGPILYILGRRDGKTSNKVEELKRTARAEKNVADFYRDLEASNAAIKRPASRDELVNRVRSNGL